MSGSGLENEPLILNPGGFGGSLPLEEIEKGKEPTEPNRNKVRSERGYAPNELQEGTWVTVLFRQVNRAYGSVTMANIRQFYTDNGRDLTEANAEFLEEALKNSQYAEDELSL